MNNTKSLTADRDFTRGRAHMHIFQRLALPLDLSAVWH